MLVWSIRLESAIHIIVWASHRRVRVGRNDLFALNHTSETQTAHQAFHIAAGNVFAASPQNVPNLPRAAKFAVVGPSLVDLEAQGDARSGSRKMARRS